MALSEGQRRLYAGDFNSMSQIWQDDGSVIVTLRRQGDFEATSMHLDDLYGPKEELLLELVSEIGPEAHLAARQAEAEALSAAEELA